MAKTPKDKMDVLADATVTAQALSLTCSLVMTQLLTRWALRQTNPSKSVRNMYDPIVTRLDSGMDLQAGLEPTVVVEARKMIDELFLSLGESLDRRRSE